MLGGFVVLHRVSTVLRQSGSQPDLDSDPLPPPAEVSNVPAPTAPAPTITVIKPKSSYFGPKTAKPTRTMIVKRVVGAWELYVDDQPAIRFKTIQQVQDTINGTVWANPAWTWTIKMDRML